MATVAPFSHCSFCGALYPVELTGWPRTCPTCGNTSYRNPLPVAVAVVPVENGVLLVRRTIPPQVGQLALPGGFINLGESWQSAAAREVHEETGFVIDPAAIRLFDTRSAPDGTLLVFGLAAPLAASDLAAFTATSEASEVAVATEPITLAFSLHTEVLALYFERFQA